MKTIEVGKRDGSTIKYCAMNDLPALVWAANLADLELHTFLHRAPALMRPMAVAFDLNPGAPADIVDCCQVGLWVKEIFDELGLESFPKTSGSKGLQVYVPLNTPVLLFSVNQEGSRPAVTAKVYDPEPPKALKGAL